MIAGTLPVKMCLCQYLVMKIITYLDKFSQGWELPLLQSNTVDSTKKKTYHSAPMSQEAAFSNKLLYFELIQHLSV